MTFLRQIRAEGTNDLVGGNVLASGLRSVGGVKVAFPGLDL